MDRSEIDPRTLTHHRVAVEGVTLESRVSCRVTDHPFCHEIDRVLELIGPIILQGTRAVEPGRKELGVFLMSVE